MEKFFAVPFAVAGNKTDVPNAAAIDGSVSFTQGYPIGYQQDPDIDPLTAKDIERNKFNGLLYNMTKALQELQAHAVPDFITSAMNEGTPWSYSKQDLVRWNNGVETLTYESLVNSNTSLPSDTTKWRQFGQSQFATGMVQDYIGNTLPSGWIWPDGKTVGNSTSNATNRANSDTYDLFVLIWNSYSNALNPIYNSDGSPSSRGASAAADWAANKAITVTDLRGINRFGRDDMGGTAANRVTTAGSGISGITLGAFGGSETVTLSSSQIPAHTHAAGTLVTNTTGNHAHTLTAYSGSGPDSGQVATGGSGSSTPTVTTSTAGNHSHTLTGNTAQNFGGGVAHKNMPPGRCVNVLVKL